MDKKGEGIYGIVYEKENRAIKKFYESATKNMINQEIKNLKKLKKEKYIIKYYNNYEKKDGDVIFYFLEMELAENGNIYDYIVNNNVNYKTKKKWIKQICIGIYNIHKNNIIHNDLNCRNILLSKKLNVRIADFGFSIDLDDENQIEEGLENARWCAPEKYRDENGSFKTDIFTIGCIIYYILTEKKPYDDISSNNSLKIQTLYNNGKFPEIKFLKEPYKNIIHNCWYNRMDIKDILTLLNRFKK